MRYFTRLLPLFLGSVFLLASCSTRPTPYQPKIEGFGYEETRLQENVYRISFKANSTTEETDILDYLYLRSAELSQEAGYSHFVITSEFGKTEMGEDPGPRFRIGLGFSSSSGNGTLGTSLFMPLGEPDRQSVARYRIGVLIIRMMTAEEAKTEKNAFEVTYLIESIRGKL